MGRKVWVHDVYKTKHPSISSIKQQWAGHRIVRDGDSIVVYKQHRAWDGEVTWYKVGSYTLKDLEVNDD